MAWSESKKQLINEIRYEALDPKRKSCPVCGRSGVRLDTGEFKHTRRIKVSPAYSQVQTNYCNPLKREA